NRWWSPLTEARDRILTFVAYAQQLEGRERGEAQVFLDRLFQAFGHAGYAEAGARLEDLVRDQGAARFVDLKWGDRVLIEMKGKGERLQRHYRQTFDYWLNSVPHRPKYVVLCNFTEFWIYDFNLQLYDPVDRVSLDSL